MNNRRKNPIVPFIISIIVFVAAAMVTIGLASYVQTIPELGWEDNTTIFFGLIFCLLLFIFHRWAKWLIN